MNIFKQHEFYETTGLSLEEKINLLNDSFKLNRKWWVDELDVSKSYSRQKIEMSYDDILGYFNNSCHFVVIQRNGYDDPYGEIGFSTLGRDPEYFLWLILELDDLYDITNKYKLEK